MLLLTLDQCVMVRTLPIGTLVVCGDAVVVSPPSSLHGRAEGRAVVVDASNASMRDVRSFIDVLSSVESRSAWTLHVLMPSMVVNNLSCAAWRAFTSMTKRSIFSSTIIICAVKVGGFFP